MRAAVIQLSSQEDVTENLRRAGEIARAAAASGARLLVLPENFAFMGEEAKKRDVAEPLEEGAEQPGPIGRFLSGLARETQSFVVAGGLPEASGDAKRPYNTSALFAPTGRLAARYRKVHLFDVDLPDGTVLKESAATTGGDAPVTAPIGGDPAVTLGMTICYDLRFPELFRRLAEMGSRIVTVPAAFTLTTGKDHWHVLLRARAIENQVFVLAAAQHGKHPRGRVTYGKSLVVDPWGDVLAQCPEGEGYAACALDFAAQDRVRAALPCLSHRKM